jgi:hypothetical protein
MQLVDLRDGRNFLWINSKLLRKIPDIGRISRFASCDVLLKNEAELSVFRLIWLEFILVIGRQ